MGFFSSIVSFIKSVVQAIVTFVANIFGGGESGVFIACLAILVVSFVLIQPQAFTLLMNSPWLFLEAHPILSAIITQSIITLVSIISPELGRALGYTVGLISFIMTGLNIADLAFGTDWAWRVFSFCFPASTGLAVWQVESLYTFLVSYLTVATVAAALSGPDSGFAQGLIDGFFAIPEVVAAAADVAVGAALSGVGSVLLWFLGGWLAIKALSGGTGPGRGAGQGPITLEVINER